MHILILDDDKSYGALLASAAKKLGHICELVQSPDDAMTKLGEGKVEALLVDLSMPEQTGIEFAENMRSQGHRLPLAFCTGTCRDEKLIARALAAAELLPRVWTHTHLKEILVALQKQCHALANEVSHQDADELGTQQFAAGTGAQSEEDATRRSLDGPLPSLKIRCKTWEQVRFLYEDMQAGIRKVTVRARDVLAVGQQVALKLNLPDDTSLDLTGSIRESLPTGASGKTPYRIEIHDPGDAAMASIHASIEDGDMVTLERVDS